MRLQIASRSVAERASEFGSLLINYSKPGSTHAINKYPLDILEESRSTVQVYGLPTRLMNSSLDSTSSWSNVSVEFSSLTSLTHLTDDH